MWVTGGTKCTKRQGGAGGRRRGQAGGVVAAVAPEEIAALLAVPPDEFVAARTARVRELKADGQKEVAAALAKVRKPLRLVWIVGELARRHPAVAETAAGVAVELEQAQAAGGGVRPLLKRFRAVVAQVAELADELDVAVDRLEVGLALREVLADPDAREAWVGGHLLALPGDEESPVAVAPVPRTARSRATPPRSVPNATGRGRDEEAEEARRAHAAAVAAARAAVEDLEGRVAAAEEARPAHLERIEALDREREQLQARVERARQDLDDDDAAAEVLRGELDVRRSALTDLEERGPAGATTPATSPTTSTARRSRRPRR